MHQPQITNNSFLHTPPGSKSSPVTLFFISGNPGLIGYYHTFLSLLSSNLASGTRTGSAFQIYARSLAGFDVGDEYTDDSLYSLEDQIQFVQRNLDELIRNSSSCPGPGPGPQKVILIGHSVGSYIAMEVLRRRREEKQARSGSPVELDIIGGVMLFPTVIDIAKSPSGRKLSSLLSLIPQLALIASLLAALATTILPDLVLRGLLKMVMGSPPDEVLDTTIAFLRSRNGVRQAIHMGADEMRTITSDKWTDDIWGVGHDGEEVSKLVFYFGKNDHWVADRTRDEIIEVRGKNENGPKMVVCEDGVSHAFCLRHSDVMARKVGNMVREIVGV